MSAFIANSLTSADVRLQPPAKTESPSTESSLFSSFNMNSTDDHTSDSSESNPFFSGKAASAVNSTQSCVARVYSQAQGASAAYEFPAIYNADLGKKGLYMTLSHPVGEWVVFSQPRDLCYRFFTGQTCDPEERARRLRRRGHGGSAVEPCRLIHTRAFNKHLTSDPPMTHEAFAEAMLGEYKEQLVAMFPEDTLMTSGDAAAAPSVDAAASSVRDYTPVPELELGADGFPVEELMETVVAPVVATSVTAPAADGFPEEELIETVEEEWVPPSFPRSHSRALATPGGQQLALVAPSTQGSQQMTLVVPGSQQLASREAIVGYAHAVGADNMPENPTANNALAFARNMSVVPVPRESKMSDARSIRQAAEREEVRDKYAGLLNSLTASTNPAIIKLAMDPRLMDQFIRYKDASTSIRSVMADKAKTMKCAHTFLLGDKCPFGSSCTFAHSEAELRPDLSNITNIVVNGLLADGQQIDLQKVIEALVAHFVRDDMIELVDAVFACLERYSQQKKVANPQKPLFGIYVDENCLARMIFERHQPRTDPKRGLNKEYLPHLLTLHQTLVTFLTHPDLAEARRDYSRIYDFSVSMDLLDIKDSDGLILRDDTGVPVSDIVSALVWGYNQCSKNRQFPYHEMAYVAITMPDVREVYSKLDPRCKEIVEDAFSLTDYCMGGAFGCSHGGHSNYTRQNDNGVVFETLLNLDEFFGINNSAYDETEFVRLGKERDGIMQAYYELLKELFELLRDNKIGTNSSAAAFAEFKKACRITQSLTSKIVKTEKKLAEATKKLATFNELCAMDQDKARAEIVSLTARIDALSITVAEKRRLHSKRAELERKVADKAKTLAEVTKKFEELCTMDLVQVRKEIASLSARNDERSISKLAALERKVAEKEKFDSMITADKQLNAISYFKGNLASDIYDMEANLDAMRTELAKFEVLASDSVMIRLRKLYQRMHFLKREFRATTSAYLKVAPRPGNCVANTYHYGTLQWWSDTHVASTAAVGHGIETVSVAEPHVLTTNPEHLPAMGIQSMQQTELGMAIGAAVANAITEGSAPLALTAAGTPLALTNGSTHEAQNQLALSGGASNVLAVHGGASNSLGITFAHGGFVPCDAEGKPVGRTAARLENDQKAAEALAKREAGRENTLENFPASSSASSSAPSSASLLALTSTAEPNALYADVAAVPASAAAVTAAAAVATERRQAQRSWARGDKSKKKPKGVPMKVEIVLTSREAEDFDDGYGDNVCYEDSAPTYFQDLA